MALHPSRSLYVLLTIIILCWTAVAEDAYITVGPYVTPTAAFGSAFYGSVFDETVTLPQFDPALGTLQSISLTLSAVGTTTGWNVDVYNPFPFDVDATGVISGSLRLLAPDSSQLVFIGHFSPFTPLGTLAAQSTTSLFIPVPDSTGTELLTSPADLAWFIGTGTVALPVDGFGYPNVFPSTLGIVSATPQMGYGSVTATYNYTPIPEPGTLALVGGFLVPRSVSMLRRMFSRTRHIA